MYTCTHTHTQTVFRVSIGLVGQWKFCLWLPLVVRWQPAHSTVCVELSFLHRRTDRKRIRIQSLLQFDGNSRTFVVAACVCVCLERQSTTLSSPGYHWDWPTRKLFLQLFDLLWLAFGSRPIGGGGCRVITSRYLVTKLRCFSGHWDSFLFWICILVVSNGFFGACLCRRRVIRLTASKDQRNPLFCYQFHKFFFCPFNFFTDFWQPIFSRFRQFILLCRYFPLLPFTCSPPVVK